MVFVDTPLPDLAAIRDAWGLGLTGEHVRLHGGENSAAYRIGDHVVRVGALWQTTASLEWSNRVAAAAALEVPEVVVPIATPAGSTVVRIDRRPVTLWPFIDGVWSDEELHFEAAADLLARVHRALHDVDVGPTPADDVPLADAPELADLELDEWLDAFEHAHPRVQPQHGDFYHGNMLAIGSRIVALVDWDGAFVGPPEVGLANGAWEWGDGLWADSLDAVFEFIDLYVAAGGTAPGLAEVELRQLVRARLRSEVRYGRRHNPDPDYEARVILLYNRLRP